MATPKKKTNYIGYELEWLERKCNQLKQWVEEKLDNGIEDRIHETASTRGNPIIKVIASEETQIKCLRDTLKELPVMLMEINNLRKKVEEEDMAEKDIRGGHDVPGFMDDDEVEEPKKESKKIKKSPKAPPPPPIEDDGDFEEP